MRAIITDDVHAILIEEFRDNEIEVDYLPDINQAALEMVIHDYEILIVNSKIIIDKKFIDLATKLKIVGRLGSGLEIIDLPYAKKKNIAVFNSPEGNRDAVGEHAIGLILSLFNNLNLAHQDVLNFTWNRPLRRGEELKGKCIGIIGFGNTGKAFAQKLQGFEVNILYHDIEQVCNNFDFVKAVSLNEIFEKADVVSFHLPYKPNTHYFFNEEFIEKMNKPFYVINTSRGKIVSTKDLLKGIESGKILGACLDVFENEKTETYSLKEKKMIKLLQKTGKVQFSTHVAGWTNQSKFKLAKIISEKILDKLLK
jgi:D-3-phosphoglycerate dehydrogenase